MPTDWLPDFIDEVPTIDLLDPLGAFLTGNPDPLPVTYRFVDVVKLSGHCCPTVGGAWAMLLEVLPRLYGDAVPVRGEITIEAPGQPDEGAMGPFTQVLTYVTGAAGVEGFHGLGGHFRRAGLLSFGDDGGLTGTFSFTRTDTGQTRVARYDAPGLPADPELGRLLPLALEGQASAEEFALLGRLWQGRVRELLLSAELRRRLVTVS